MNEHFTIAPFDSGGTMIAGEYALPPPGVSDLGMLPALALLYESGGGVGRAPIACACALANATPGDISPTAFAYG